MPCGHPALAPIFDREASIRPHDSHLSLLRHALPVDEAKFPRRRAARCAAPNAAIAGIRPAPSARSRSPARSRPPLLEAAPDAPAPEPELRRADPRLCAGRPSPRPQPRAPLGPKLAVVAGWVGLIAVVLLIGFSAVRYRQEIAVIWPQSAGVYSSLGLKVNASGIDFRHVDYRRESEDGQMVLAVTGQYRQYRLARIAGAADGARDLERCQQSRTLSLDFQAQCADPEAGPVGRRSSPGFPARPPPRAIWKCASPKTAHDARPTFFSPPKRFRTRVRTTGAGDRARAAGARHRHADPGGRLCLRRRSGAGAGLGRRVDLDVEMIWLRSYGDKRVASAISMIAGPSEQIAGRHVLVIDGVLDAGRTIAKAVSLIQAAGAASVQVAVMLDKQRRDAVAKADYVGFAIGNDFVDRLWHGRCGRYRGAAVYRQGADLYSVSQFRARKSLSSAEPGTAPQNAFSSRSR